MTIHDYLAQHPIDDDDIKASFAIFGLDPDWRRKGHSEEQERQERQERIKRYANDLGRGEPIAFIEKSKILAKNG